MLLDVLAYHTPINLINPGHRLHHLINILHQKACLPIDDNLRGSSAREGDHRTAYSHSFNHHHAKWLLPLNRIEESPATTKQAEFLAGRGRADKTNLIVVDLGLNDLLKVVPGLRVLTLNSASHNQWHLSFFRGFNCQMRPLLLDETTKPAEIRGWRLFRQRKVSHRDTMMHRPYKVQRHRLLLAGTLADSDYRNVGSPHHKVLIGVTSPVAGGTIKREMAM